MRELKIGYTGNTVALVDDEDYEQLAMYCWTEWGSYAHRTIAKGKTTTTLRMHRMVAQMHPEIYGDIEGYEIDHIDHNRMNNTKSNLRKCTHRENMQNMPPSKRKRKEADHE